MNNVEEAIDWLKKGGLIIIADDEHRESEGDLLGLSEYVTPKAINFMTTFGRGLICAPVSETIARRLGLDAMTENNTDVYGTAFTISVDHKETMTGISAFDRAKTIEKLADPSTNKKDFHRPGHIFPLIAKENGVLERRGHTEAAIDLAKLAGSYESAYICEILNEDGSMARLAQLKVLAKKWKLPLITIEELTDYIKTQNLISVSLPTIFGDFELTLYEDNEKKENLLLSKGDIRHSKQPILVRIHSECLTGDIFGSKRCDCGEQLHQAMDLIEQAGQGAILYLRQEGRGIGLKNKLRTYQLQEQGRNTYEANVDLGFAPDERDYTFAAKVLHSVNLKQIKLLTNNPEKVNQLEKRGINVVERIGIETQPLKENEAYLRTKKVEFHHHLSLERN